MEHWTYFWNEMRTAIRKYNQPLDRGGCYTHDYLDAHRAAGRVLTAWADNLCPTNIRKMKKGLMRRLNSMDEHGS